MTLFAFNPYDLLFIWRLRQHWGEITCYDSCEFCDPLTSCDFSSCYDDTLFTENLLDKVKFDAMTQWPSSTSSFFVQILSEYCIDLESIHQSGRSNGGMFSYHLAAHIERLRAQS